MYLLILNIIIINYVNNFLIINFLLNIINKLIK